MNEKRKAELADQAERPEVAKEARGLARDAAAALGGRRVGRRRVGGRRSGRRQDERARPRPQGGGARREGGDEDQGPPRLALVSVAAAVVARRRAGCRARGEAAATAGAA
jgi:hypothetical protein